MPKLDRHFHIFRGVFLALILILTVSCITSYPDSPQTTSTDPDTPRVAATRWTALIEGKLILDDNHCLRVEYGGGDAPVIVWPPDFKATLDNETVHVVEGLVTGIHLEYDLHIGDDVAFGGGFPTQVDPSFFQISPTTCPGPFWAYAGLAPAK